MTTQTCKICHRSSEDTIMTRDGHVLCRPCAAQAASALGCAPQDLDLGLALDDYLEQRISEEGERWR